jgi:hypothetical protein
MYDIFETRSLSVLGKGKGFYFISPETTYIFTYVSFNSTEEKYEWYNTR